MTRDRTARTRIREHLAQHGPVADSHGLATKVLKDVVGYDGSPVAFIQLIAAMERDGELVREIRGKRTYRIAAASPAVAGGRDGADGGSTDRPEASAEQPTVDYDVLARSLLRELAGADAPAALERIRADNLRIAAERDDYSRRLELARAKLDELRSSVEGSRAKR